MWEKNNNIDRLSGPCREEAKKMGRWSMTYAVFALAALTVAPFGLALAGEGSDGERAGRAAAPPAIDVQRDSDRTVYSIGSSPKNNSGKSDKDRSWDMLNNVLIDARGAHGKRPDNNR